MFWNSITCMNVYEQWTSNTKHWVLWALSLWGTNNSFFVFFLLFRLFIVHSFPFSMFICWFRWRYILCSVWYFVLRSFLYHSIRLWMYGFVGLFYPLFVRSVCVCVCLCSVCIMHIHWFVAIWWCYSDHIFRWKIFIRILELGAWCSCCDWLDLNTSLSVFSLLFSILSASRKNFRKNSWAQKKKKKTTSNKQPNKHWYKLNWKIGRFLEIRGFFSMIHIYEHIHRQSRAVLWSKFEYNESRFNYYQLNVKWYVLWHSAVSTVRELRTPIRCTWV